MVDESGAPMSAEELLDLKTRRSLDVDDTTDEFLRSLRSGRQQTK